jgi:hypothetical protein
MTKITLRRAVAGGALALAVALAGNAYANGGGPDHGRTIRLVEAGPTAQPAFIDLGPPGPTTGDLVVVKDGLSFQDGSHAGDFDQTCTLLTPGTKPFNSTYDCASSIALATGTITMQGPFDATAPEQLAAVTGGTGVYRTARGDVQIQAVADQITVRLARG